MWITVAVFVFWLVWGLVWLQRRERRSQPLARIEELSAGTRQRVHGLPTSGNEVLRAPLTNRECVYFQMRVVLISGGEKVLAKRTSKEDLQVDDGTGSVAIPLSDIRTMDVPEDVVVYSEPGDVFERFGIPQPKGNLSNMIVYERIIPTAAPIFAIGVVAESENKHLRLEACEVYDEREPVSVDFHTGGS